MLLFPLRRHHLGAGPAVLEADFVGKDLAKAKHHAVDEREHEVDRRFADNGPHVDGSRNQQAAAGGDDVMLDLLRVEVPVLVAGKHGEILLHGDVGDGGSIHGFVQPLGIHLDPALSQLRLGGHVVKGRKGAA